MEKTSSIIIKVLFGIILLASFNFSISAQTQPIKLALETPQDLEISGGENQIFSVSISKGQTARVEIIQNGVDVSLTGINPNGEKFIWTESPSGLFGEDLILVTAKETGEYKIEVTPANPRAKPGKYTIVLKDIRKSTIEDFQINEASEKITKLAEAATIAKYKGTIEGKRESIDKWNEAIKLSKIKKDKVWEGIAFISQGLVYLQLSELQSALDSYLASLKIWEEIKNDQYKGSAVNNIGQIYADLGEHERAIPYYEQAIEIQRKTGDISSVGVYLNNLAYTYMEMGDYEKAEDHFRQSLVIKKENQDVRGKQSVSNTLNNLGYVLSLKGETEEGIKFLQEALDIRRELNYKWGIANSTLNIGKTQWDQGLKEQGVKNLQEANLLAKELGDRRMISQSYYQLAIAEKDKGNSEKAIEHILNALDIIEQIRNELISSQTRYAYFSTVQNYYELYTDLLVSSFEKTKKYEFLARSLEMSERSRSRSLLELLQEAKVNFRQSVDKNLLQELRDKQIQLNEQYAKRQRILSGTPKPVEVTNTNNEINSLNTEIEDLQIKIRRENPKYSDLIEGKTISESEIQRLLDDDTILIEYKLGKDRSFVWFVTNKKTQVYTLPTRKEIEAKAETFYDLVISNKRSEQDDLRKVTEDLSEILLSGFSEQITGKRVVIVPDGFLQYTPFSALMIPQTSKNLADENEIVILPSASVLDHLRKNPSSSSNSKTIAIFADPVFDKEDSRIASKSNNKPDLKNVAIKEVLRDFRFGETLPRLLSSRQEAKSISSLVSDEKSLVYTDFESALKNIENEKLSDYRIIHFATHGLLNISNPELSGLVFSLYDKNGQPQEGFLSLNNIYNLKLSSDMVVLSACQTALGKDVRGEGLVGISRGFLYAGSNRIVASLWKVDDSATAEFMQRFYQNHLQKGMSASAALRETKSEMKKIPRYRSPYYWSAFTLLGDWK